MTRFAFYLAALLALSFAGPQTAGAAASIPPPEIIVKPWHNITAEIVLPENAGIKEIPAREQDYGTSPSRLEFAVVALRDPNTKKLCFLNRNTYYLSTPTGMVGIGLGGSALGYMTSLLEVDGSVDEGDATTAFERKFPNPSMFEYVELYRRVDLRAAAPEWFFFEAPMASNEIAMTVTSVDYTNGILHFDLQNPNSKQTASFWVDLSNQKKFSQKVIRATADGQPFPIPPAWRDKSVKLLSAGTKGPPAHPSHTDTITAKASYTMLGGIRPYGFVAIEAPTAKQFYFVPDGMEFFLATDDGVFGCVLSFRDSSDEHLNLFKCYLAVSNNGGFTAAADQIEKWAETQKFDDQIDFVERSLMTRLDLRLPTSSPLFADRAGKIAWLVVKDMDLTDGILQLDLNNVYNGKTGTVWIDLKARKTIRAIADGQEVDLAATPTTETVSPAK